MNPIEFPEVNTTFAKNQPQYKPLPVFKDENGTCVSCWKFSLLERFKILFTGKLWLSISTFNKPLQPILPTTEKSDVLITEKPIPKWKQLFDTVSLFVEN